MDTTGVDRDRLLRTVLDLVAVDSPTGTSHPAIEFGRLGRGQVRDLVCAAVMDSIGNLLSPCTPVYAEATILGADESPATPGVELVTLRPVSAIQVAAGRDRRHDPRADRRGDGAARRDPPGLPGRRRGARSHGRVRGRADPPHLQDRRGRTALPEAAAASRSLGLDVVARKSGGGTDGSFFNAKGIPCVALSHRDGRRAPEHRARRHRRLRAGRPAPGCDRHPVPADEGADAMNPATRRLAPALLAAALLLAGCGADPAGQDLCARYDDLKAAVEDLRGRTTDRHDERRRGPAAGRRAATAGRQGARHPRPDPARVGGPARHRHRQARQSVDEMHESLIVARYDAAETLGPKITEPRRRTSGEAVRPAGRASTRSARTS